MSLNDRLAAFFRARSNQWIDGKVLACVAGGYGWRTRASCLRRPPYSMRIVNRQRRIAADEVGDAYIVSEYRYEPEPAFELTAPEMRPHV